MHGNDTTAKDATLTVWDALLETMDRYSRCSQKLVDGVCIPIERMSRIRKVFNLGGWNVGAYTTSCLIGINHCVTAANDQQ